MTRRYYTGRNVQKAISIEELRHMAKKRIPDFAYEFIEGGAEDELSLAWNREAFAAYRFVPRTLVDTSQRHTRVKLFGIEQPSPLVIAPTGHNNIYRRGADMMLARAAAAMGIPMGLSTLSNTRLERLPKETSGRFWMQIYQFKDEALTLDLVRRADAAGYEALAFTTDTNIYGLREWDRRHFKAPGELGLRGKIDALMHLRWMFDVMIPHGVPKLENIADFFPPNARDTRSATTIVPTLFVPDITWKHVDQLRRIWPRKLLIKGILSLEDAHLAADHGCDGVILSNHGARHIDSAISPMQVLPEIAAALGDRLTIVIDSGFKRGSDIVKAMALGAHAVQVGRAALWGVAAGGEAGVMRALHLLQEETYRVLGQIGCQSFDHLGPHFLAGHRAS